MEAPVLKFIKSYWFIIVFIGSLVAGWVNFTNTDAIAAKRDDAAVERISLLEEQHAEQDKVQNLIQVQLSQIQTDLQWIKLNLKK